MRRLLPYLLPGIRVPWNTGPCQLFSGRPGKGIVPCVLGSRKKRRKNTKKVLTETSSCANISLALSGANKIRCASGGIGRLAGFRCQCSQGRAGSTPASRTTKRTSKWMSFLFLLLTYRKKHAFPRAFFIILRLLFPSLHCLHRRTVLPVHIQRQGNGQDICRCLGPDDSEHSKHGVQEKQHGDIEHQPPGHP